MKFSNMKLSIIIPAYNEEKRILGTLKEIDYYSTKYPFNYEVLIVDDGSTDNTNIIVDNYILNKFNFRLFQNSENSGKGYSIRKGVRESTGDLILFTDADLHTSLFEMNKFLPYLKDFDVIIASRSLSGSLVGEVLYRRFIGEVFSWIVQLLIIKGIPDTQCGFKLFTKKAAKTIFQRQLINGWAFDVEILFLARKLGFRIKDIPVTSNNPPGSKVNPITAGISMFRDLLKIRFYSIMGYYR